MTLANSIQLLAGFVVLLVGAELLVRGASRMAASIGMSPIVVGISVVAVGTSAPELAITLQSVMQGQTDIGVGNIIGSNISNVLLILGVSALIAPLVIAQRIVRLDVPVMIFISLLALFLAMDGALGAVDGVILVGLGTTYVAITIRQSGKERREVKKEYEKEFGVPKRGRKRLWIYVAMVLVGMILLALGSRWLVLGAVALAELFGLSELIIGLTVIAIGTSLPELVTSVVASLRNERDIAVGNIIGSNVMNLAFVLGIGAVIARGGLEVAPSALHFDFPVMIAAALACLPVFYTGQRITRWEGALFLVFYIAYVAYLTLNATEHDAAPALSVVMMSFVIPITVVTLGILTIRTVRARRAGSSSAR